MKHLSYLEIDAAALRRNVAALRTLVPSGTRVAAVVKANAYGHGLGEVVRAVEAGVDGFQVDDIEELRAIRSLTEKPVLVLGYVPASQIEEARRLGGELAVYDAERLSLMSGMRVHLKVDALLGRQGVPPAEISAMLTALRAAKVNVVAAYAHFANIEDTTDLAHAHAQIEAFESAFAQIRAVYPEVGRHFSATSGLMTVEPEIGVNAWVRLGIGVYGQYPSVPLARTHRELNLRPALRWVSHLAQVKMLPARHPIGYGLTYITTKPTRVGIVPQGYSDGYDRGLSSAGEVLVGGVRCPVLGRIAMNMFAIDLSDVPTARVEDEVVLLGRQGEDEITADEIAARLGTIHYEVLARLSPLLPRETVG